MPQLKSDEVELWANCPGYDGLYEVSSLGRFRSVDRYVDGHWGKRKLFGKILSPGFNAGGYKGVNLCSLGRCRFTIVHRMVALAFVENPRNMPWVNHIDGDKKNNAASNLEWCSPSENALHSFRVLGRSGSNAGKIGGVTTNSKSVIVKSANDSVMSFYSGAAAARHLGVYQSAVYRCLVGDRKDINGNYVYRHSTWEELRTRCGDAPKPKDNE